jgi:hypothetical protein
MPGQPASVIVFEAFVVVASTGSVVGAVDAAVALSGSLTIGVPLSGLLHLSPHGYDGAGPENVT